MESAPKKVVTEEKKEEEKKVDSAAASTQPAPSAQSGSSNNNNNNNAPTAGQAFSQDYLSNLLSQMPNAQPREAGPALIDVLESRSLQPLLCDDEETLRLLLPLLPEVDRSAQGLRSFLSSPQWRQAVQMFNYALVKGLKSFSGFIFSSNISGHMPAILNQLGINPNNTVQDASVIGSFLKTLEKNLKKSEK